MCNHHATLYDHKVEICYINRYNYTVQPPINYVIIRIPPTETGTSVIYLRDHTKMYAHNQTTTETLKKLFLFKCLACLDLTYFVVIQIK